MSESFNIDVQQRAYNAAIKLAADQLEYLETQLTGNKTCLEIENAYHKLTGLLLEPVIARYWMDSKHVVLKNPEALKLEPYSQYP